MSQSLAELAAKEEATSSLTTALVVVPALAAGRPAPHCQTIEGLKCGVGAMNLAEITSVRRFNSSHEAGCVAASPPRLDRVLAVNTLHGSGP